METYPIVHPLALDVIWAGSDGNTSGMLEMVAAGCPWPEFTTLGAARSGQTETMLAAVAHGCPWAEETTAYAAAHGHTETMLAAVRNGCPWDPLTGRAAVEGGHTDSILATLDNGGPDNPEMWHDGEYYGHWGSLSLFPSMMYLRHNDVPRIFHHRQYYDRGKMRALLRVLLFISNWIYCTGHGRLRDIAFRKVVRRLRLIRSGREGVLEDDLLGARVDNLTEKRLLLLLLHFQ